LVEIGLLAVKHLYLGVYRKFLEGVKLDLRGDGMMNEQVVFHF
jgi:hypothetical protein